MADVAITALPAQTPVASTAVLPLVEGGATKKGTVADVVKGGGALMKDGSVAATSDLPMGGQRITGLGTPSAGTDAATKDYVDAAVAAGGSGSAGIPFTFDAATDDSDPGAGEFKLNHATPASATAIYIDDVDGNGNNRRDQLARFDDMVGSVKGYLYLEDASDEDSWIEYSVGGYTSATGYSKLTGLVVTDVSDNFAAFAGEVLISFDAVGLPSSLNNQAVTNARILTYNGEVDNGNSSTADTIDWTAGQIQKSTLTDNCTYTFTAPAGITGLTLRLTQDGTGGRTVTWPVSVIWIGGSEPTLSSSPGASDFITFFYDGTSYYGFPPVAGSAAVADDSITMAKLANLAGNSIIGRAANTTGDPAAITAGSDGHALRLNGTTLGFGTLATGAYADGSVTLAKLANGTARSILGRASATGGVYADIVASTDGHVLFRSAGVVGFGQLDTIGDASSFVGLEHAYVGSRDVVALCRATALSTTQMPAGTGDGVAYIGNAATEPATGAPVSGTILWSFAGKLKARGPSAGATAGNGIWELAPDSQWSRYYAKDDTGTTNSTSITTIGTFDLSGLPDDICGIVKAWVFVKDASNPLAVQEVEAAIQIHGGTLQSPGGGNLLSGSIGQGAASFDSSGNNLLVRMTSSDAVAKTYKVLLELTFTCE